jgi:hypothetical protein
VGEQRLVDFDRLHQVGRHDIELDLAHVLRGGYVHPVNGHITKARFGAANLHVFAFALVALQGHAWQAADGVCDVGIGEAGDDVVG